MNNSIVVIGHPLNLIGLKLGKLIDSFPNVARVNKIKDEYSDIDKGKRMTHWLRREPPYQDSVPKHVHLLSIKTPAGPDGNIYYQKWGEESKCLGFAREHTNKILQYPKEYVRTTGVILLSHLVYSLDYWPVFIVGWFDLNMKLWKGHSYSLERLYIQYLINERKVYLIE